MQDIFCTGMCSVSQIGTAVNREIAPAEAHPRPPAVPLVCQPQRGYNGGHPTTRERVKRLEVRRALCSGCLACEVACVARHEGAFGTALARVRVAKDEAQGLDVPHVCRQCRRAPCLAACPHGALQRDPATGAILLQPEACTGCLACADACPFGAVWLHPHSGLPLICNLCGGDPACVRRCATGALRYGGLWARQPGEEKA
ncbi:MAG: 4Fe-4S dicluster domain-containing protein [Chloroflexi bacterium]|nr:4Fe-4S dicluster domain-containing protein [Chloroflexota bacterium]